ncbi:MAG: dipicolinate synthase subunit DpsA [Oscillospiraceae bacterium]|nr:dipicolinate synthase subunit DpsA [Oscillospiraceae bacterium]
MDHLNFAVIGGDMRQAKLAELLAADGHRVSVFALEESAPARVCQAPSLDAAVQGTDCVILPLPITRKHTVINTPLSAISMTTEDVFSALDQDQLALGGLINEEIHEQACTYQIPLLDYYIREELVIANAVTTAEGAIQIAMEETPITLWGSRCLILGFGRIGKVLAHRLRSLGTHVTVSARTWADLAWIRAYGYESIHTHALDQHLGGVDILFNTIPRLILGLDQLCRLDSDTLCIDLSSRPGGVDFEAAERIGIKTVWALSLPGKVAPVTSAMVLRDTIYNILQEQEQGQCQNK